MSYRANNKTLTDLSGQVQLITDGGVISYYEPASDSNAARGTILKTVITAAGSGDTIVVGPGTYDANLLLKNGVNYYFLPGAIIDYTGTTAGALFADGGSDFTISISGEGQFIHRGNNSSGDKQVFNIEGASTGIVRGRSLYAADSVGFRLNGVGDVTLYFDSLTASDGTVDNLSNGGTIRVHARRVVSEESFCLECDVDGHIIAYVSEIESQGSIFPLTVASGGTMKVYGARIIAPTGVEVYEGTANGGSDLELHNCVLEYDTASPWSAYGAYLNNTIKSTGAMIPSGVDGLYLNNYPVITTGTAAPETIPNKVGDIFIDITNDNVYVAKGVASSADWVQVNN